MNEQKKKILYSLAKYALIFVLAASAIYIFCSLGNVTNKPKTYETTRETWLFEGYRSGSLEIRTLPPGTKVQSASCDGMGTLICVINTDFDFTLCKIEIVESGEQGWVFEQHLED